MKILLVGGMSTDATDRESLVEFGEYMQGVLPESTIHSTHLDKIIYDFSNDALHAYDSKSGASIDEYQAVYIRGPKMRIHSAHAYYVSRYCNVRGIRCVNDYSLYYPGTKVAQQLLFYEEQAPFIRTLYAVHKPTLVDRAESVFGYPFILKTNVGSHGDSNHLVKNREDALAVLRDEPNVDFVAQAFYLNDRDYRVLLAGEEMLLFERRGMDDSHINNTSKGAEAQMVEVECIPAEIVDACKRVTHRLHLEISGVDVMPHLETGEFVFLEINSQPQLRTGAFLEEKKALVRKLLR